MVGSGGGGAAAAGEVPRSKEAAGMMALHEALRNVCVGSDWTYSVFWTIRPRPRCRGGNGCKVGDDNGSLMLMWEDGFCRPRSPAELLVDGGAEADAVQRAFSKMSIQLYNYGEGLMGKVASDKCHKWVFKEPAAAADCEPNVSSYWQSSFDALPPEWTDQFNSGIQTIAVIQAGHGLLQLGSCKIIPEDLHFVLRMRHMFESLGYQSGFFLSQLFSSSRSGSPAPPAMPMPMPTMKQPPTRPSPPFYGWNNQQPLGGAGSPYFSPMPGVPFGHPRMPPAAQEFFHPLPHPARGPVDGDGEYDGELKWPSGMSFFTALTGRADDAKMLLGANGDKADGGGVDANGVEDYLSLESHANKARRMDSNNGQKFKRSFTLPARTSPSSSASASGMEQYRGHIDGAMDVMDTFLE